MWRWRLPLLELVPCLDWEFCCFQLYLGSSSGLDIALEEVCWCNLDCDIQHCYSPRCYPLCARYWVTTITITDISYSAPLSPLTVSTPHMSADPSETNLPQMSADCAVSCCPTYIWKSNLFYFTSHHSLPAYRDCSMGIDGHQSIEVVGDILLTLLRGHGK